MELSRKKNLMPRKKNYLTYNTEAENKWYICAIYVLNLKNTVISINSRDDNRHGKAFKGLLDRYFGE